MTANVPIEDRAAAPRAPRWSLHVILTALIAAAGVGLRLVRWAGFTGTGFDERLYDLYLRQLTKVGLTGYPDIVDQYIVYQTKLVGSILPPTRFMYIFSAYLWHGVFGGEPILCLHAVSRVYGVAALLVGGLFVRRLLGGGRAGLAVFALLAFSPLEIHLAQHALVDGVFMFWATWTVWSFWECLQTPRHRGWLAAYTLGLAAMVTTKENAFFVFMAILALMAANRLLRFGTITRPLMALTVFGPLIGVAVLANIAGGLPTLIHVYSLSAPKNLTLPFAIMTGDGPWYRYLIDLMTISPLVLILALATVLGLRREDRPQAFVAIFIVASYLIMCNLKYGMNLRYASIWDLPLRVLAVAYVGVIARRFGWAEAQVFVALVVGLCAFDLFQYYRMMVVYPMYELVPTDLLRSVHILKDGLPGSS